MQGGASPLVYKGYCMRRLNLFLRIVDVINEWVGKFVSLWIIPMIFIMVFEVFMRYGLKSPTVWGTELVSFLFAAYILMGGGYTHLHGDHVNMNVVYSRLSVRKRAVLDLITSVAFFLYCGSLLKEGGKFAWETIEMGRRTGTDWNPPLAPALVALPIGVFLLFLQGIIKFIRDLFITFSGEEPGK